MLNASSFVPQKRRRPEQRVLEARRAFTTRRRPIGETRPKTRFHEILRPDSDSTGSKTPGVKAKLKGRGGEERKSPVPRGGGSSGTLLGPNDAAAIKGKWRSGLSGGVARGVTRVRIHIVCRVLSVLDRVFHDL